MDWGRRAGMALAVLLIAGLGAAGPAAAAPARPPIAQLRVDGKLTCTATIVAPRFALTAAHCTRHGTRALAVRHLTVVIPGKKTDLLRVAAVDLAPRASGHSVDLALLQLTASSKLAPATLPATAAAATRAGKPARAFGWTTKSKQKSVRGTLAVPARCGSGLRGALCARLVARAPSPRCADAGGAALTVTGAGKPVLVGVGSRGTRGCGSTPALPFVDVRTAAIRAWVAATVAQTAPAPGAAPSPLAAFVGHWSGTITEDRELPRSYEADISIDRAGAVQEVVGSSRYALSGCGGSLTFASVGADGSVALLETLAFGQSACIDGGTVTLAVVAGQPELTYAWTRGPDDGRSSGVLQRAP